ALPRLAVPSVLSAASSFCPDLNLIHYTINIFKSLLALLVLSMPSGAMSHFQEVWLGIFLIYQK
ncbi:TPA: hypothetical protein ACMZ3W_000936, partial [Neisseria gonorrhoeae]